MVEVGAAEGGEAEVLLGNLPLRAQAGATEKRDQGRLGKVEVVDGTEELGRGPACL